MTKTTHTNILCHAIYIALPNIKMDIPAPVSSQLQQNYAAVEIAVVADAVSEVI